MTNKWIGCLEAIIAMIFLASLSSCQAEEDFGLHEIDKLIADQKALGLPKELDAKIRDKVVETLKLCRRDASKNGMPFIKDQVYPVGYTLRKVVYNKSEYYIIEFVWVQASANSVVGFDFDRISEDFGSDGQVWVSAVEFLDNERKIVKSSMNWIPESSYRRIILDIVGALAIHRDGHEPPNGSVVRFCEIEIE